MVVESWEANLDAPHFLLEAPGTICECWHIMYKNVHRLVLGCLWVVTLEREEVEELLCLLVFVWSPKSEDWPRYDGHEHDRSRSPQNFMQLNCAPGTTRMRVAYI